MSGPTLQFARGEPLAFTFAVKRAGVLQDLTNARVLFKLMRSISDSDAAALALIDNLTLGGVSILPQTLSGAATPTFGQGEATVPEDATYSLPNVQANLYGELWCRDGLGTPWLVSRITCSMLPRGLQQQP